MTQYRVTIVHDACTVHDVESCSPEEAVERAMESCGSVTLCHHCSDELQMGDPIRAACVENLEDGTHIDAVDPEVAALQARVAELEAAARAIDLDARRYRWLRNESWAGYHRGIGVWTEDGAGNRKTMLAEGALDDAVDSRIGQPANKPGVTK